jgi:hypothetical protein
MKLPVYLSYTNKNVLKRMPNMPFTMSKSMLILIFNFLDIGLLYSSCWLVIKLAIFLPLPPKCCNYRCAPPCPAARDIYMRALYSVSVPLSGK